MTTHNVKINRNRKQRNMQFRTRNKHVVCRRYSKATPDIVKKIRTMVFKPDPYIKRDIDKNKSALGLEGRDKDFDTGRHFTLR